MTLADLPDIDFVETDAAEIKNHIITTYEALSGRTLYPADPVRLFLLSIANIMIQQRVLINQVSKGNLLKYATGDVLDHIGALYETERLPAAAATSTFEFTLSAPLSSTQTIPLGTRIGPQGSGGLLYFATTETAEIPAGSLTVSVSGECSIAGDAGNGFLPGQLNVLIDPIPYVQSVQNTTESSGGSERETDEAYRERIHKAPESFSSAGPQGAYEYWAKTANSAIVDVAVESPAPMEVSVIPLLSGGEIPGEEILHAVESVLNDRKIRPMTDKVTVSAPEEIPYNITLTYWINQENSAESEDIQQAVNMAINDYVLWQKSKLGRDINPAELIRRIMDAGALRVDVTEPAYTELSRTQVAVAVEGTMNVTYGGLVDD